MVTISYGPRLNELCTLTYNPSFLVPPWWFLIFSFNQIKDKGSLGLATLTNKSVAQAKLSDCFCWQLPINLGYIWILGQTWKKNGCLMLGLKLIKTNSWVFIYRLKLDNPLCPGVIATGWVNYFSVTPKIGHTGWLWLCKGALNLSDRAGPTTSSCYA